MILDNNTFSNQENTEVLGFQSEKYKGSLLDVSGQLKLQFSNNEVFNATFLGYESSLISMAAEVVLSVEGNRFQHIGYMDGNNHKELEKAKDLYFVGEIGPILLQEYGAFQLSLTKKISPETIHTFTNNSFQDMRAYKAGVIGIKARHNSLRLKF